MLVDPASEEAAAAIVRDASAAGLALSLQGGGTRSGLGRPVEAETVLSTRRLRGVTLYEPSELVIGARAGTSVRELVATLAERGQMLPVEPMEHGGLYGSDGESTVGGLVATNASGPRRIKVGAIRDHLIGVRFVNGRGELIKSGGRVMKNVTGLDLVKLQCGAHGTLGLLTEVIFKVLPRPETAATLSWTGLDDTRAVSALTTALGSPFEPSGAAHQPAGAGRETARTFVRLEGFAADVARRLDRVAELLQAFGAPERIETHASEGLWDDIRDGMLLAAPADSVVWRVSVPPTRGPAFVERVRPAILDHAYDWGGGLVWLAAAASSDGGAETIRAALRGGSGHATMVRAPAEVRERIAVFEPPAPALLRLSASLKRSLDPAGIFNPGRMYAGV